MQRLVGQLFELEESKFRADMLFWVGELEFIKEVKLLLGWFDLGKSRSDVHG